MLNFYILFTFFMIGYYLYEFYQEEKKKDKRRQANRRKNKNRQKFDIDVKWKLRLGKRSVLFFSEENTSYNEELSSKKFIL